MPQVNSPQDALDRADRWLAPLGRNREDPQTKLLLALRNALDTVLAENARLKRELARLEELTLVR